MDSLTNDLFGMLDLCRFEVVLGEIKEGATVGREAVEPNGKRR